MDVEQSLAETVRTDGAAVLATLIRWTGDMSVAEDAVQEASIAALRDWSRSGIPDSPRAWLITAARRKAVDLLRREGVRRDKEREAAALMNLRRKTPPTLPLTEEIDEEQTRNAAMLVDEENTPENTMLQTEIRTAIQEAIAQLPETLRQAFILRHVEGFSTKAAATTLGIEESALKVRLYRARQELRKLLVAYQ